MAGLGDAISLGCKPTGGIEFHNFFSVLEDSQEEEKTADDGSCATFAVIAVEYSNSIDICAQKLCNFVANEKERIERRGFVVFPVVAVNVLEFFLFYAPSADVDGDVFILMGVL